MDSSLVPFFNLWLYNSRRQSISLHNNLVDKTEAAALQFDEASFVIHCQMKSNLSTTQ